MVQASLINHFALFVFIFPISSPCFTKENFPARPCRATLSTTTENRAFIASTYSPDPFYFPSYASEKHIRNLSSFMRNTFLCSTECFPDVWLLPVYHRLRAACGSCDLCILLHFNSYVFMHIPCDLHLFEKSTCFRILPWGLSDTHTGFLL